MKNQLILGVVLSLISNTLDAKRHVIDRIVARVNGANILQSDLEQPRISKEGSRYSLDELTLEELLVQRAGEMHMLPTALDIDRQVVTFKIQNHLTELSDIEFENQLKQSGFTLKAYKQQLGRLIAAENVKRAEISEKIVITSQEVEEYHATHPEKAKEEYLLQTCVIKKDQLDHYKELLENKTIAWEELGWIAKKDIGHKFKAVLSMKPGDMSEPVATDDGTYQAVKLLDKKEKRFKALDERYSDIERKLQQERKEKFIGEFEKELKAKASIVIL